MRSHVTFFLPRGASEPFEIKMQDGTRLWVWTPTKGFRPDPGTDRDRLEEGIRAAGGGIIVAPQQDQVRFNPVSDSHGTFEGPQRVLRMSLDGPPEFVPIQDGPVATGPGARVLVPINSDAEQQLVRLRDDLEYLPSDYEQNVWNLISRPSLDWRIKRLEDKVLEPDKTQKKDKASHGIMFPPGDKRFLVIAGIVLTLVVGMVALAILLALHGGSATTTPPGNSSPSRPSAPAVPVGSLPAGPPKAPNPKPPVRSSGMQPGSLTPAPNPDQGGAYKTPASRKQNPADATETRLPKVPGPKPTVKRSGRQPDSLTPAPSPDQGGDHKSHDRKQDSPDPSVK